MIDIVLVTGDGTVFVLPEVGVFVENGDHFGEGFYVGFRVV